MSGLFSCSFDFHTFVPEEFLHTNIGSTAWIGPELTPDTVLTEFSSIDQLICVCFIIGIIIFVILSKKHASFVIGHFKIIVIECQMLACDHGDDGEQTEKCDENLHLSRFWYSCSSNRRGKLIHMLLCSEYL